MELVTEIISLSKIRDGLFIADSRAGENLDLLMQFKISHIINATGIPLSISFESVGIKYLTLNWPENPSEDTIIINDEIINSIVSFIDESNNNGEGLLGFCSNGKNRICAVIIFYLITKYNWPLKKCLEYVKKKKKDMEINNYYMNQLELFEKKIFSKNNIINSPSNWNENKLNDKDEIVMRNTYMNEIMDNQVKNEENKDKKKNKLLRNIIWGDNKKYVKQMAQPGLIHYNIDKDLFLQQHIEDITDHINKKPLMSCLKNSININTNINISKINTTNKRRRTKIYLAADVHPDNTKESFSEYKIKNNNTYCNESKEDTNNEILLTQKNNEKEEKIINNKERNIFEDISITEKNEENNNKLFAQGGEKENSLNQKLNKINDEKEIHIKEKNSNKEERIINNLEINNNDSDDEVDLNIININNKNKGKKDEKLEDNKQMKDYGLNIINVESKKESVNNDLKPLINNLLKIDPNLETLNKYLKRSKKNNYLNFTNIFSNFQSNPNKKNPNQKWTNANIINKKNINIINENKNIININNVNLVPINSLSIKSNKLKINKEEKKKSHIYINNINFNTENNNANNINNALNNKIFINKKFNNYFMDANGNNLLGFNKKKRNNNNSARIEYLYNGNNTKFLNQNKNYYLLNNDNIQKKENKKQTITIIPNINIDHNNRNIHTSNSQKNSKKNIKKYNNKNKIISKHEVIINKNNNNNNNIINKGETFLTNIINSNNFNSLNIKGSK